MNEDKKIMRILMDEETYHLFIHGDTKGEVYLPLTASWKERLFVGGRRMDKEVQNYQVIVMKEDKSVSETFRITGADIRHFPIRRTERADKHIVLTLNRKKIEDRRLCM